MTETPKCPYCGAKMKLNVSVDLNDKWNARYICDECYSMGPFASECQEKNYAEEVALVFTLHRDEPKMRPLTLAEALELGEDDDSIVYIESRRFSGHGWYQPCAIIFDSSAEGQRNEIHFYEPGNDLPEFWPEAEYGKSWRCWPRKPTPEHMAAAKWEE